MSSDEGLGRVNRLDADRQGRFRALAQMRGPFAGVSLQDIECEVAQAIAEVRRENRLLDGGQLQRYGAEEHRGDEDD